MITDHISTVKVQGKPFEESITLEVRTTYCRSKEEREAAIHDHVGDLRDAYQLHPEDAELVLVKDIMNAVSPAVVFWPEDTYWYVYTRPIAKATR